jgi:hypothetical protein
MKTSAKDNDSIPSEAPNLRLLLLTHVCGAHLESGLSLSNPLFSSSLFPSQSLVPMLLRVHGSADAALLFLASQACYKPPYSAMTA